MFMQLRYTLYDTPTLDVLYRMKLLSEAIQK